SEDDNTLIIELLSSSLTFSIKATLQNPKWIKDRSSVLLSSVY
ncbi:1131_t:CDS:1, partial [Funneliformis mosseae]